MLANCIMKFQMDLIENQQRKNRIEKQIREEEMKKMQIKQKLEEKTQEQEDKITDEMRYKESYLKLEEIKLTEKMNLIYKKKDEENRKLGLPPCYRYDNIHDFKNNIHKY